jgi:hypothetical protein
MSVLTQRVRATHHEERAVHHVAGIENPGCGGIQRIAFEDLGHHHQHQGNDQPGKGFAHPGADLVHGLEQFDCVHWVLEKEETHPAYTGWV